ncbi:MAG: GntR family transcriptional regulator [Rhodobacteraceae bacterium]|nr:GntR family transcriptional regulator [Paracoccaceae bacterium]
MKNQGGTEDQARKIPTHEVVYCQLRDMILFGQLAPGQPVTIQGLTDRLGAGMTPVREAIRKLIAENALEFQGNRRVSVPVLNLSQLHEIEFARSQIEPELSRIACKSLTENDISALRAVDAQVSLAIGAGDIQRYLLNNYRFHFALYELARSPVLLSIAQSLWLRFGPSLRIVCGRFGTSSLPDRHMDALAAMEKRDCAALAAAISQDISQGISMVRLSLSDQ